MAEITANAPKAPLGVGGIISESFSILFGNFVKVAILGFLGAFLGFIVNALFLGLDAANGNIDPTTTLSPNALVIGMIASVLINMVMYGLITALLIQLAYDAKLGRSNSIGAYLTAAMPAVLPIAVLTIIISILSSIGAIALIIGALWVLAVFYATAPVAVIEKGGFKSMGRSAELTKEYRWPIVGLLVVVYLLMAVLQFIGGFAVGALLLANSGIVVQIMSGIGISLITGLAYAFAGIAAALVYARLREIKEGVDVDQIAAVFD